MATLLVSDAIWRQVTARASGAARLVVVDEAWLLMRDARARGSWRAMAKSARKHWAGLAVITQDAADVLGQRPGAGDRRQRRDPDPAPPVPAGPARGRPAFGLSAGERAFLLTAERGGGLLLAGSQRAASTPWPPR